MGFRPRLTETVRGDLRVLVDDDARGVGALVGFTDRHGGSSAAPYETLNLAARVGDDLDAVTANRTKVAAALGFEVDSLALARQVHGSEVLEVGRGDAGVVGEGDVLVAREPGVTIGIFTADCVPAVILGEKGIAIAHAGWRGLVAGAIEVAVRSVGPVVAAWIGPSIRASCYEVGPEVIDAFEDKGLPVAGSDRVDTGDAASAALRASGVANVVASDACTYCDERYFSFRRDGVTGRQGAFAALIEP